MGPANLESGVTTTGMVGMVGMVLKPRAAKSPAEGHHTEPLSRASDAVVVTEADAPRKSTSDPMRSVVRDILGKFLDLSEPVNDLVNRYVEVFGEQPDYLDVWRLRHVLGNVTNTISSLEAAIASMLTASEEAGVGPAELERISLERNRNVLRNVEGSLMELVENAPAQVASPESRRASLESLRGLMDDAWRATTMLFKIASKVVMRLLNQVPQWTASSEVTSAVASISADASKPQSSAQVVNH
jgi:hypothetical protein